jgi:hypothetical protein
MLNRSLCIERLESQTKSAAGIVAVILFYECSGEDGTLIKKI